MIWRLCHIPHLFLPEVVGLLLIIFHAYFHKHVRMKFDMELFNNHINLSKHIHIFCLRKFEVSVMMVYKDTVCYCILSLLLPFLIDIVYTMMSEFLILHIGL